MNPNRKPDDGNGGRLWSRMGLCPVYGLMKGVYIEWHHDRLTRVDCCPRPPAGLLAGEIYADHLLTPGLLNAHSHLDYSFLRGSLPKEADFTTWLRELIRLRRSPLPGAKLHEAHQAACREAVNSGTTEIWDIVSDVLPVDVMPEQCESMRIIRFHEWICHAGNQVMIEWERFRKERFGSDSFVRRVWPDDDQSSGRCRDALSVHSVYSVCDPAMQCASHWARENHLPVAVHLAESPGEIEMMMNGCGTLIDLLNEVSAENDFTFNGRDHSPIRRVADAGLLNENTLAIHCNLPQDGDLELLAESGAVVVFCPRSHAYFGYPAYPLEEYMRHRIRLALGTDSLASNDSLSMLDELRAFNEIADTIPPLGRLAIATGAKLGDQWGCRGRLGSGCLNRWAVWPVVFEKEPETAADCFFSWLATDGQCVYSSVVV
jgi:cytosine/adenosine deaminase-related metal-dependent hydrolase